MRKTIALAALLFHLSAHGVEFEKVGTAISKALGTKSVFKTVVGDSIPVYYAKNDDGKPVRYAVVKKETYPPNCTHTWVMGLTASGVIKEIRVVEMACPHAFPANKASFLDQYKGKGKADVKKLKNDIHTVASATGSCDLTTDAVIKSIAAVAEAREKF